jgi:hypothetical protein
MSRPSQSGLQIHDALLPKPADAISVLGKYTAFRPLVLNESGSIRFLHAYLAYKKRQVEHLNIFEDHPAPILGHRHGVPRNPR